MYQVFVIRLNFLSGQKYLSLHSKIQEGYKPDEQEAAWYAIHTRAALNQEAVVGGLRTGEYFRQRSGGGLSGKELPRWGQRGGKKSAYWNAWHGAKRLGADYLRKFEDMNRDKSQPVQWPPMA